jgi:hypothetical protein
MMFYERLKGMNLARLSTAEGLTQQRQQQQRTRIRALLTCLCCPVLSCTCPPLQLYKWDFSVFDLEKLTGGRPLYHVTLALLKDQGLLVSVACWARVRPLHRHLPVASVAGQASRNTCAASLTGACVSTNVWC